jgi:hypothetical protein
LAQEKLGRAPADGAAAAGAIAANSADESDTIANIRFLIIMRRFSHSRSRRGNR